MTFVHELREIIQDKANFSPDDIAWFEHVVNDDEEVELINELFHVVFHQCYDEMIEQAKEQGIDLEEDHADLVLEAGRTATRSLLAFSYLTGVVSQRKANSTLLEQLGGTTSGRDS
jgi:hypothetical protein